MKNPILFLLILLSGFSLAQTPMTKAEIKDFVYNIITENQKIKTLQSDFVQIKKLDFLDKDIVTAGTMSMQSPNILKWQYTKPYQYSVIFKSGKIYINDQGKKSTVNMKSDQFEKISQMITGSANGKIFVDPDFAISYFKNGQYNIARFVPKQDKMKQYIQQIELHVDKDNATVSKVVMLEASGDTTSINFKNTQLNVALPASVFNP